MPRRLAQQRMTLSDHKWPFHASRAISAIAEPLVASVLLTFDVLQSVSYCQLLFYPNMNLYPFLIHCMYASGVKSKLCVPTAISSVNVHLSFGSMTIEIWNIRLPYNRSRATCECVFSYASVSRFCSCDLDLDPMTLTYERDLDILKMYQRTKNEDSTCRSKLSKVKAQRGQTDRQTDRHTDRRDRTYCHSRRIRGWQNVVRCRRCTLRLSSVCDDVLCRNQADGAPLMCASLGRFILDGCNSNSNRNNMAASQTRMKGDQRHLAPATQDTATDQVKMADAKHKVMRCFYLSLPLFVRSNLQEQKHKNKRIGFTDIEDINSGRKRLKISKKKE